MQNMDGITFVQSLRRLPEMNLQVLPVIMVTGHANRGAVQSARDAGVNELLVKPFTEGSPHPGCGAATPSFHLWADLLNCPTKPLLDLIVASVCQPCCPQCCPT
jgi:hypothetical protein